MSLLLSLSFLFFSSSFIVPFCLVLTGHSVVPFSLLSLPLFSDSLKHRSLYNSWKKVSGIFFPQTPLPVLPPRKTSPIIYSVKQKLANFPKCNKESTELFKKKNIIHNTLKICHSSSVFFLCISFHLRGFQFMRETFMPVTREPARVLLQTFFTMT